MKIHKALMSTAIIAIALASSTSCTDDPVANTSPEGIMLQLSFGPSCDVGSASRAGSVLFHEPIHNFGAENENVIDDATIVIYATPLNEATSSDKILKVINMATSEFDKVADLASVQVNVNTHYYRGSSQVAIPGSHRLAYKYFIHDAFGKSIVGDIIALGGDAGRDLYAMAFANLSSSAKAYIQAGLSLTALRDYVYTDDLYVNEELQYDADGNPWSKHASIQKTDSYGNLLWNDAEHTVPTMWTPSKTGECQDGRDHVCYKDCHHFVMSAANEIRFNTKPVTRTIDDTEVNVVEMTTDTEPLVVKRLAARIDIAFGEQAMWDADAGRSTTIDSYVKGSNPQRQFDVEVLNDGTYLFPIYDEQYYQDHHNESGYVDKRITGGLLKMWGIEMKNVVDNSEYLIQRSIQGGNTVYFGTAGTFNDDYSAYYVPSTPNRPYKDYALARVSGQWNGQTFSKDVSPVSFIEPALFLHPVFGTYENDTWPYAYYSIMGYFCENTFATHSADNNYTAITIKANINIAGDLIRSRGNADGSGGHDYHTAECTIPVKVTFPIRHSFGDSPLTNPYNNMAYAMVRNTVYRIYIRFFAMGTDLVVRYYYYDGVQGTMEEIPYPSGAATVNINPFIQESGGAAVDD